MIDTVNIFYPHLPKSSAPMPGWRYTHNLIQPGLRDNRAQAQSQSCDENLTGYHVYGKRGEFQYHRASLPRLVFGNNGLLLKNQVEVDNALSLLFQKAGAIGEPSVPGCYHFTRVDLVWQFAGDAADFIRAHREARHPRIRSGPSLYTPRSMAFDGTELRVSIYDKTRECTGSNGDIVRVELQLKGRVLKELLGNGNRVTSLNFDRCYQAYRQILLGFAPKDVPRAGGIPELLAIGEMEGWKSGGATAFEIYTSGLSSKQVRRIRQRMATSRLDVFKIDWAQLLPADGPPPPVEFGRESDGTGGSALHICSNN